MKSATVETGIWKLEVTLYESGNIWLKLTNKLTGGFKIMKSSYRDMSSRYIQ